MWGTVSGREQLHSSKSFLALRQEEDGAHFNSISWKLPLFLRKPHYSPLHNETWYLTLLLKGTVCPAPCPDLPPWVISSPLLDFQQISTGCCRKGWKKMQLGIIIHSVTTDKEPYSNRHCCSYRYTHRKNKHLHPREPTVRRSALQCFCPCLSSRHWMCLLSKSVRQDRCTEFPQMPQLVPYWYTGLHWFTGFTLVTVKSKVLQEVTDAQCWGENSSEIRK